MFIRSRDGWSWFLQNAISGYTQSVSNKIASAKILNEFFQCIDVARIAKVLAKGKLKAKADKETTDTTTQYDYEDGSVHDGAVRAHILRGYERFKVRSRFRSLTGYRSLT
jgi:hypothetical protein